jgi:hypothetical protein
MRFSSLAALAAIHSAAHAQRQNATTWVSTSFISEDFSSSITVRFGDTAVTPVPTSTAPLYSETSYIRDFHLVSKNINQTTWAAVTVTEPLAYRQSVITITRSVPPTVTIPGTQTDTIYTSPTVATVTFAPTTCTNSLSPPKSISTVYTGTYTPFPGQVTTTSTRFPTAVTTYFFITASYRVNTYIGTTSTTTSTYTDTSYLSTTTTGTVTVDAANFGKGYTRTRYSNTITTTFSDWQLAYTTKPVSVDCKPDTPTMVTYAAKCAPTNLISERDGRGVEVRWYTNQWSAPIGFPDTLIGIPGLSDASACCQLCVDNKGCAASEWTVGWDKGCRLYFYNTLDRNGTCGGQGKERGLVEYFGNSFALPRQASFVQTGCGEWKYLGGMNPFCPTCEV